MKKFVFSLESLYDLKNAEELQEKIIMQSIMARLNSLNKGLESLKARRGEAVDKYNEDLKAAIFTTKLADYNHYFESISNSIKLQKERIAKAEKERQESIDRQVEIKREIKSLDKLYEIELEDYKELVKQEEYKEVDDLISYRVAAGK